MDRCRFVYLSFRTSNFSMILTQNAKYGMCYTQTITVKFPLRSLADLYRQCNIFTYDPKGSQYCDEIGGAIQKTASFHL